MSFATATSRAASPDLANRRLAGGLLLSALLHALLLSLQFGVPGLGLPSPSTPQPIRITLAPPAPAPLAVTAPPVEALPPSPAPVSGGMRLVAPAPPAPVVAKAKPVKRRRISRPLPPREPVESPTRVIAQDQNPNDSFVVPLPQPQESVQKTADPKEAQEGSDDGAAIQAAQAAEAKAAQEAQQAQARLLAAQQAEADSRKQAEASRAEDLKIEQQLAAQHQKQVDERIAQLAQEQMRKQQADQLAAKQKAEELAFRQKADELLLKQKAEEVALRQKAEELVLKQKADEVALRQEAEELALKQKAEELALRQKAEEALARQRAEDLARQKAVEVARQQAEQAAREQAEQVARQQAEQVAAAGQRERERAASAAAPAAAGNNGAGAGGTGATVPKNLLGSDAGNRVRELTRGIDLLSGAPPQRSREQDERGGRRVVVGSAERDVPLRMYVDSFRQKVERNGGIGFTPMDSDRVRIDPLVSVAIRADGSVEEVTIVRSSGHAETDNAVRRIIRVNARYSVFPPNIAAKYDVIEIRRIWSFAETLKLLEELR